MHSPGSKTNKHSDVLPKKNRYFRFICSLFGLDKQWHLSKRNLNQRLVLSEKVKTSTRLVLSERIISLTLLVPHKKSPEKTLDKLHYVPDKKLDDLDILFRIHL